MSAAVALGCGVGVRLNAEGIESTGPHARLTADAEFVIKINDTIGAAEKLIPSGPSARPSHHRGAWLRRMVENRREDRQSAVE